MNYTNKTGRTMLRRRIAYISPTNCRFTETSFDNIGSGNEKHILQGTNIAEEQKFDCRTRFAGTIFPIATMSRQSTSKFPGDPHHHRH